MRTVRRPPIIPPCRGAESFRRARRSLRGGDMLASATNAALKERAVVCRGEHGPTAGAGKEGNRAED